MTNRGSDLQADLLVVGGGWAGLTAAAVAAGAGLDVVLIERSDQLGGTASRSAGAIWAPGNAAQIAAGVDDGPEPGLEHMLAVSQGAEVPESRAAAETYVRRINEVVEYLARETALRFEALLSYHDYRSDLAASRPGRTMVPPPFEAARLGDWATRVARRVTLPPIGLQEVDANGGYGVPPIDFAEMCRRDKEDIRFGGPAGSAALVEACLAAGASLSFEHRALELLCDDMGAVTGAWVQAPNGELKIHARSTLLATGGADWDLARNAREIRTPFAGPATMGGSDGDGHRMATQIGVPLAMMGQSHWTVAFATGEVLHDRPLYRPCLLERSQPHAILVNRRGERFVNEATPYNDLVAGGVHRWDAATYDYPNHPFFLIVDQAFRDTYLIGGLPPQAPVPGWLSSGETLGELAATLGIDGGGLQATVERFNADARDGVDRVFARGEQPYERYNGDQRVSPNPSLGPLDTPPFYGVQLHVSTVGHKGGVLVDGDARVLDERGEPVPGLYAAGNVAASVHHNIGYTGGAILGRGLLLGYLAAKHAASPSVRQVAAVPRRLHGHQPRRSGDPVGSTLRRR